jgi:hypothetical protein
VSGRYNLLSRMNCDSLVGTEFAGKENGRSRHLTIVPQKGLNNPRYASESLVVAADVNINAAQPRLANGNLWRCRTAPGRQAPQIRFHPQNSERQWSRVPFTAEEGLCVLLFAPLLVPSA